MCVAGFRGNQDKMSLVHTHTHGFSLCFGFVPNIAKCCVFDVFPFGSDIA